MSSTISIDHDTPNCAFNFADGRRCTNLRHNSHQTLCLSHAKKLNPSPPPNEALGAKISEALQGDFITACTLNTALAQLFTAVAQGKVKPKTANALTYLARTILETIPLAKQEFTTIFGHITWRDMAATTFPDLTPKLLDPRDPKLPAHIADELRSTPRR